MVLKREDFPEMTDDQWNAIVSEGDRRATSAAQTAVKGHIKEDEVQARIDAAIQAERDRLTATEAERLEMDRQALEQRAAEIARQSRQLTATQKLTEAGFGKDKVEALLPLFANVADDQLGTTIDTFVATTKDAVTAGVEAEKQALLDAATPPVTTQSAPVGAEAVVQQQIEGGDLVGAAESLLKDAGLVQ